MCLINCHVYLVNSNLTVIKINFEEIVSEMF